MVSHVNIKYLRRKNILHCTNFWALSSEAGSQTINPNFVVRDYDGIQPYSLSLMNGNNSERFTIDSTSGVMTMQWIMTLIRMQCHPLSSWRFNAETRLLKQELRLSSWLFEWVIFVLHFYLYNHWPVLYIGCNITVTKATFKFWKQLTTAFVMIWKTNCI